MTATSLYIPKEMRKNLSDEDIEAGKKVSDVYSSGEELAAALVDAVGKKKAQGMLAFAANVNRDAPAVYGSALSSIKDVDEEEKDEEKENKKD